MKFNEFLKIYNDVPLIDSSTFPLYGNKVNLCRQVHDWVKKGYLQVLKKGLYLFSEEYRKNAPAPMFAANYLVNPSYISLEYALGLYDLIPEKVTVFTSVTTKKTRTFQNFLGRFDYQTVKKNIFFGYQRREYDRQKVFIALPEKALADYIYLRPAVLAKTDFFAESMRLQNTEQLKPKLLISYKKFYDKRTAQAIDALLNFRKQEIKAYRRQR